MIAAFRLLACATVLVIPTIPVRAQTHSVSGYVTDKESGEALIGAAVYIRGTSVGAATNVYGYYALALPDSTCELVCTYIGYQPITTGRLQPDRDSTLSFALAPATMSLNTVVIEAKRKEPEEQHAQSSLSATKVVVKDLDKIPAIGGEVDVIKVAQLMPGVTKGIDGSAAMFVRGGDGDQNLILLDGATVYNASHLFGFFSVFNPDALHDISLVKAGFPAEYGGRLSSVLDIRMKEGNSEHFHADGGVGLLSSRLTLQGPIKKGKASFLFAGRRTYIDQVLKTIQKGDPLPYYFYDVNAKMNWKLTDKDRIFLSTFSGNDVLRFKADVEDDLFNFRFLLGNVTATARWNHVYGKRLFSNVSLIHSQFHYDVSGVFSDNHILIKSTITDYQAKADFEYFHRPWSHIKFGSTYYNHRFRPNVISTTGDISSTYESRQGNLISTYEGAMYVQHERKLGTRASVNYGLRYSATQTQHSVYDGLEPRFALSVKVGDNHVVTTSYTHMKQYMHLVSSSSIALPTDLWYPVTDRVPPQSADQVALGTEKKWKDGMFVFGLETYYKEMQSLIEYREGAQVILNDNYEDELIRGRGVAYGTELMLRKNKGRFSGWISYSLSWTRRYFDELNDGEPFFAKYDRRHNLAVVGNYQFSERIGLSAVWVYASGAWFTPLTGQFLMPNASLSNIDLLPIYSGKNASRFPDSHRMDMNLVIRNKPGKKFESAWFIGGYNLYNRTQPFLTEIQKKEDGTVHYVARGLFGFIPSVAYNFRF
ncbi:MAG: TonB-dependent receptor [Flavobacteriales bacterium]|nr:TonB-dependent receptor [Flavobacteriales bacterium]MCB9447336.1 TonB-dependent receptor [Flavobacteriales bacterium]